MGETIGCDLRLRDATARVVGTVEFVLDHRVPGMAHAKTVRSPLPHARILGYHVDEALAAPGVVAVVTGADVATDPSLDPWFGTPRPDQPVLALDKVRYAGEPVAVVVAETGAQAEHAATLVDVTYDELPFVVDATEAAAHGAPSLHDRWPDNGCGSWKLRHGDCDAALASADLVLDGTYYSPPASHVPMEPFVCVAQWVGVDDLEVWTSAQAPHAVREGLEKIFGLPEGGARVRTKNVGGGYGAKGQVKIEPMVALAARAAGRPVRMELARDEVFATVGKHAAHVRLTTGFDATGRIVARRVEVNYNAGAYAITSVGASGQGLTRANGPYAIPNVAIDSVATYTNTVPTGPFRGAMTSQLAFAYESQLDDGAARLGLDPVEIRRRNVLRDGDIYPTGEAMHDMRYTDMLDDLAEAVAWTEPSGEVGPRRARGKGLAVVIKNTLTPSRSEARLRVDRDGRVHLYSSSVEMGQGASATLVQITADALGVHPDRVVAGFPDTRHTPFDTTTSSSRTTYAMGQAITRAAEALREQLSDLAASRWGVGRGLIRHDGDTLSTAGPHRATWAELLERSGTSEVSGHGEYATDFGVLLMPDPHDVHGPVTAHWHQGGAAAEVEVDLDTGRIEVLRMHAACFAGRVVNPLRVRQQNQGCVVMGLGPTLFEELHYQDGALSNPNLSDYMIPSIVDVPAVITSTALESDDVGAELHGVGEMALPAVSPAVANAVFAATGVRITELPLTPERVLRALEAAGACTEEKSR